MLEKENCDRVQLELPARKMHIKTIVRIHFTLTRMCRNKRKNITSIDEDVEKVELIYYR